MAIFEDRSPPFSSPSLAKLAAAEAAWISSGGTETRRTTSDADDRERRIREAAYLRAQERGFQPGHELEDWLAAEQEVDRASRPSPRD
jgi:hypothetical protein